MNKFILSADGKQAVSIKHIRGLVENGEKVTYVDYGEEGHSVKFNCTLSHLIQCIYRLENGGLIFICVEEDEATKKAIEQDA